MKSPSLSPRLANGDEHVAKIIVERSKIYGEPHEGFRNLGLAWTGTIQQHFGIELPHVIPGDVCQLMMVQLKTLRALRHFHPDNFVDLMAFARFAEHNQANPGTPYPH